MTFLNISRWAASLCVATVLLAGCGGSQLSTGARPTTLQASRLDSVPLLSRHLARGNNQVQYVTGAYPDSLAEFDYPNGDSQLHLARHIGHTTCCGACTIGSETFWVVEEHSDAIAEFAASRLKIGKPIKTLTVPVGTSPYAEPWDCSVDRTSGNLEVSVIGTSTVVIFKNGSGPGQVLSDNMDGTGWSAYDSQGDLFVQGSLSGNPALVELAQGQNQFQQISLPSVVTASGGPGCCTIRWDGTDLAWASASGATVYRLSISGNQASVVGTMNLENVGADGCAWFWVWTEAAALFCGTSGRYVNVYDYPQGGSPIAMLGPMTLGEPVGVVSLRP